MAMAPAFRVLEHELLLYRRVWRGSIFSSFLSPGLFLAAMGVGLGSYVSQAAGTAGTATGGGGGVLGGVSYLVFLAPGLLASTAMQAAAGESTFPIMGGIVWDRTFLGMLTTPIRVRDVLLGKIAYIGLRLTLVCGVFFLVMLLFGATHGLQAVLAVPAAVLTGLAFTTPIVAYSATQRDATGFNALFRFGVIPLFLFSGTFFPIAQLPGPLQALAVITPLWHGVDLCRTLALGTADAAGVLVHVAYLGALAAGGLVLANRTFRRRLEL
jgi:lipooligosaccharide transport system permease protein